jgi:predicted nucleic acid-binding protein
VDVVVDASVLAEVIVETDGAAAEWLKDLVGRDDMYWVPGLTPLEVISALRSLVHRGELEASVAESAVKWLPTFVVKYRPLGQPEAIRIWELRNTVTAYDAAYVALAETIQAETGGNAVLATADSKLQKAPGPVCPIRLYERT